MEGEINMSETETILKKKKKKKGFDYKKAVEILKPLIRKWTELDEKVAKKLHEYYIHPECKLKLLCEYLHVHHDTIYSLFDKYNLPRKFEKISESALNKETFEKSEENEYNNNKIEPELTPAEYEDEINTEFDTAKYQETYNLITGIRRLSKDMFKVVERDDLIKELQKTYKKIGGLLLELESNME